MAEYIEQGKPLGGLLLLLPRIFHPDNSETVGGHGVSSDKENLKKILVNLEQKLIHSSIHVSQHRAYTNEYFSYIFPSCFLNTSFILQYPVYFAFEDEDLDSVLADIKKNDAAGQPATATTGGLVISNLVLYLFTSYNIESGSFFIYP